MSTSKPLHEYPPEAVTWLKRDVLLFARSIGATVDELHFLYVRIDHFSKPTKCQ
jgi:hypothetical protein